MSIVLKRTGEQAKPDMGKVFKKRLKSQFEFGHEQMTHGKDVSFLQTVNIEKNIYWFIKTCKYKDL